MKRLFTAAMLALALLPTTATAQMPDEDTIRELVYDRAAVHGANANTMLCVIAKESRFSPSARGRMGERGVSQWLPGRNNAWDYTSAYTVSGIDIIREYEADNTTAVYYDVDMLAESFAKPRAFRWHHWRSTLTGCE